MRGEKKMEDKIKELIKNTNYIYDLEDALEWIMYNKEELLKILQEEQQKGEWIK